MASLYINYSRKDIEFARRLTAEFPKYNLDFWVDWEGIPPTVDWWKEIERGIEEADCMLFLVSPDSVKSKICLQEIDVAVKNGKRIVPIAIREIMIEEAPRAIMHLNWIFFREGDDFNAAMEKVIRAVQTDYEWLVTHRRLQVKALEWERSNKDNSFLLRGAALEDAENQLAVNSAKEPHPTELQREYVYTSRQRSGILGSFRRGSRRQIPPAKAEDSREQAIPQAEVQEVQPIEVGKLFSVSTDQASGVDQLNYARFAEAFATLVRNPEAKTPITIGVYGQWGSGKSFLMKKIIEVLRADQEAAPKTKTRLERIAEAFRRRSAKQTDPQLETLIIEFNAWVYSGSAHLWASLVTHLYREIERYFGVQAHLQRLLRAIKRFIPKTAGIFLFYAIPALLISLLVGFDQIQATWDKMNIALKATGVSVVGGSLLATLPVLWAALREFSDTLFMSRAMNLQKLAARPDFRDQIGIMADIKGEIGFIAHLLEARNKRRQTRVVLFIDDLDRCEHRKAVEVLQAIMLLLADRDGSPFVIFLGIDARILVRAVEEHYGTVLVKAGINGYEYLDKIVQLPFVIPAANRRDIGNYVESLIWTPAEKQLVEAKFAPKQEEDRQGQPAGTVQVEQRVGTRKEPETSATAPHSEPVPQIRTEGVPVTFTKREREALKMCVDDIIDNPRKIKRIVNIYRFVRLLLPADFEEYQKVIRWILLTEQWPLHASWVLEEIYNDRSLNGKLYRKRNATIVDVYERIKDMIYSDDMDPLMTIDADPKLFSRFIQKKPMFTVEEIYSLLYPLTFNLNPAIKSEISKYMARIAENYIQIQSRRKPKTPKSVIPLPQTESATMQMAIQEISQPQPR